MGTHSKLNKNSIYLFIITLSICTGCNLIQSDKKQYLPIGESGESLLPKVESQKFIRKFFSENKNKSDKFDTTYSVNWEDIEKVLKAAQQQTGEELIAVFSVRDSSGTHYNYYLQPLGFSPTSMKEAAGETQYFVYELEEDELGSVPRIAIAVIPAGKSAFKEMEAWILPKKHRN